MDEFRKVRVELGPDSYDIWIGFGLDEALGQFAAAAGFSGKAMVVSDTNVLPLHGEKILRILSDAGLSAEVCPIPAGEASKCLEQAEKCFTRAIELGLDRKSPIIALGGGVVGDLAGFIAATYMRGVPFVQIPTTLLAQVDSSVGGKVAVNHSLGKNLIGAFYQPKAVFIDLSMLRTLPEREIRTGLGEIVKYGVISDEDFFCFLETHQREALSLEVGTLAHMVARSCELKADVVSRDEREGGLRRILNFGHTMAHAIEEETRYVRYNHGEAVAIGMAGAAYISRDMDYVGEDTISRLLELLRSLGLPVRAGGCTEDNMYHAIFRDKKAIGGKVNWVLMEGIGKVRIEGDVPEHIVRKAMADCIEP